MQSFVFSKISPDPCKRSLIVEEREKNVLCFSDKNIRKQATALTHLTGVVTGAPNDGFLLNALKTLFRLSRVLLDL